MVQSEKQILIVAKDKDSLLPACVKAMLLNTGKYRGVTNYSFSQVIERKIEVSDQASKCHFLFIVDHAETHSLLDLIQSTRNHIVDAPILILDLAGLSILEIKSALSLGKIGVVTAQISCFGLCQALDELEWKDWLLGEDIQELLLNNVLKTTSDTSSAFTKQEQSIIQHSRSGATIKQIAQEMGLSPNTIAVYRSKMIRKSGMQSFAQLVQQSR